MSLVLLLIGILNTSYASPLDHPLERSTSGVQNRNSITGFVFGENRTPISNIYVELQTDLYSTLARTRTNGAGFYSFRGLASANYYVKVLPVGTDLEEQSRPVSLIPISALPGSGTLSEQVDFYLYVRKRGVVARSSPSVLFVQEVPDKARSLYEEALAELDRKNEDEGYSKLKQALEIFPDYYLALDRLATEYLTKEYYPAAHILFTKAIAVNPKSSSSMLGLGVTEYRLHRIASSVEVFKEAIKLDGRSTNAYYWLGIALHATNKLGNAVAALRNADKLSDGKFAEVHWQLARVYKDQNKYREAADALETYLRIKPDVENPEEIKRIIALLRQKAPASS
jgi:Tfp pilus assembly protein PilF